MPEKKMRIGLIFGGRSGEHEVSLASATSVMANLDKDKYDVVPIGITREGSWLLGIEPPQSAPSHPRTQQRTARRRRHARRDLPRSAWYLRRRWCPARAAGNGECPLCWLWRAGFGPGHGQREDENGLPLSRFARP